jgi:hypothetical protein
MVKSFARFSPFSRGRIIGKAEEGASRKKIRKEVRKKDGKQASFRAIDGVLQHHRSDPEWQGEDSAAGGRPQEFSGEETSKMKDFIFDKADQ